MENSEVNYSIEICEKESQVPERFRNRVKDGELLVKARALTTDFLPSEWLRELAKDSENGRLLYRHRDPESEKWRGRPFGRILETEIVEFEDKDGKKKEGMDKWYRVFGETDIEKTMQEFIKKRHEKGEDIGISSGYIVNRKNGIITRVFHLEDSITHIPECPQCVTQEVIQLEENKNMPNEEVDKEAKEIEKLQEELESAKLQLEEKDSAVKKLEDKILEFEKLIGKNEEEKLGLEDKHIKLSDELRGQITKLEEKIVSMEKKPFLDQIEVKEKVLNLYNAEIFEFEQKRSVEWLKTRLDELVKKESLPSIITKSLSEEREEVEEKEKEADVGTKAFRNDPQLKARIEQLQKEGKI